MLRHEHEWKIDLICHPPVTVLEATPSGHELPEALDSDKHPSET
jgi:hypothetical protein